MVARDLQASTVAMEGPYIPKVRKLWSLGIFVLCLWQRFALLGYEGQGPIDSNNYGQVDPMDVVPEAPDLNFENLDSLPSPPPDNNQLTAWYDTDL